jgi:hypothetical protein
VTRLKEEVTRVWAAAVIAEAARAAVVHAVVATALEAAAVQERAMTSI